VRDLRERFDSRGFGVTKYARVHKVKQPTLSRVLNGELTGKNKSGGEVRKIISQLKKDKVWVGTLPWEVSP